MTDDIPNRLRGVQLRRARRLTVLVVSLMATVAIFAEDAGWKAGLARVKITPERPVVLLGYGDRTGPFQSVAEDIHAKALALEDGDGRRAVMVTADLVGFQAAVITDEVCRRIKRQTGLARSQLLFNASHTHTGPLVSLDPDPAANSAAHGPLTPDDTRETIAYTRQLQDKLVELVCASLDRLRPARLAWGKGRLDFPMNRRLRRGDRIVMNENPNGPVDRSVPVLRVDAPDGAPRAVLFGCACHNTTLTGRDNVIAGDYAGFAQKQIELRWPGAQAMFLSGCGGDANPYPRGSMALAQQHGATLADEVSRVLGSGLRPVRGRLVTRYASVKLPLQKLSRAAVEQRTKLHSAESVMARHMAGVLDRGESLPCSYRAPFAVWQFGRDLTLVALPGEPVAEYASQIRQRLGSDRVWVSGYNNDCFGYLPTAQIVGEGGHEAIGVTLWIWGQRLRRNAGFFAPEVEQVVLGTVQRLASKSGRPVLSTPPPAKAAAGGCPSSQTEGAPPASRVTALNWISRP